MAPVGVSFLVSMMIYSVSRESVSMMIKIMRIIKKINRILANMY